MRAIAISGMFFVLITALAPDAAGAPPQKRQFWGAVAYNSATGAFGYAADQASRRAAEGGAFRQCGGDCDVIKSFRNSCGAIAEDTNHYAWEAGATREIAQQKALRKCGAGSCKIAVWACTTEK